MSTWRRPFALRLLAGLLVAALAWALLPDHAQAHEGAAGERTEAALAQALDDGHAHEGVLGAPCGPQATCAPTFLPQPVAILSLVAPWRPVQVRAPDDLRTHLHRHAHEPPPPRLAS